MVMIYLCWKITLVTLLLKKSQNQEQETIIKKIEKKITNLFKLVGSGPYPYVHNFNLNLFSVI